MSGPRVLQPSVPENLCINSYFWLARRAIVGTCSKQVAGVTTCA